MSAVEHLGVEQLIGGLQRTVEERDQHHGEQIREMTDLLRAALEGITELVGRQKRLEAESAYRLEISRRQSRFAEQWFDAAGALQTLEPLREDCQPTDPKQVTKRLHELRRTKLGARVKGSTLKKLLDAMGLDPIDVDEDLRTAEVGS